MSVDHTPWPPPGTGAGRLLAAAAATWTEHVQALGPLLLRDGPDLVAEVSASGLTGRSGAGRPSGAKLAAVAAGVAASRRPGVVVANGTEGEPASAKDLHLLTTAPHLVLDGVAVAAEAVGADQAWVCVRPAALAVVGAAADERAARGVDRVRPRVVSPPEAFVTGQASALVSWLGGGPALPRSTRVPLHRRGLGGAPTLVHNVETLAHLALVARFGTAWFRGTGTPVEPGTALTTTTLPGAPPQVAEVALGNRLGDLLDVFGGHDLAGVLVGGYHGAWLAMPRAADLPLSSEGLAAAGGVLGAGVVLGLGAGACPLVATAETTRWLAGASARQCGPCAFGLPHLAERVEALAAGRLGASGTEELLAAVGLVEGRGACRHPDATARLVRSALRAFPDDVAAHAAGACASAGPAAVA